MKQFRRTGMDSALNWYRTPDLNWEITPQLAGQKVETNFVIHTKSLSTLSFFCFFFVFRFRFACDGIAVGDAASVVHCRRTGYGHCSVSDSFRSSVVVHTTFGPNECCSDVHMIDCTT